MNALLIAGGSGNMAKLEWTGDKVTVNSYILSA